MWHECNVDIMGTMIGKGRTYITNFYIRILLLSKLVSKLIYVD